MNSHTVDSRANLLGAWVGNSDARPELRLHIDVAEDDRDAIVAGDHRYLLHPLHADLWRAPGVGHYLFLMGATLWLRSSDSATWVPFCRPGVAQLLDPPPPPLLRYSREALTERLRATNYMVGFEFREHNIDAQPRTACRLWIGVGHELTLWDHDGMFDLCELQ